MVDPDTAPLWKVAKWSRHPQHRNGGKHQRRLPSLPACVRLLAYAVPNEHTRWNSQVFCSFQLIGKTAAEFIFPIRRSLRISSLTQRILCIAAVQGPLLRRLSPTSVPPSLCLFNPWSHLWTGFVSTVVTPSVWAHVHEYNYCKMIENAKGLVKWWLVRKNKKNAWR